MVQRRIRPKQRSNQSADKYKKEAIIDGLKARIQWLQVEQDAVDEGFVSQTAEYQRRVNQFPVVEDVPSALKFISLAKERANFYRSENNELTSIKYVLARVEALEDTDGIIFLHPLDAVWRYLGQEA